MQRLNETWLLDVTGRHAHVAFQQHLEATRNLKSQKICMSISQSQTCISVKFRRCIRESWRFCIGKQLDPRPVALTLSSSWSLPAIQPSTPQQTSKQRRKQTHRRCRLGGLSDERASQSQVVLDSSCCYSGGFFSANESSLRAPTDAEGHARGPLEG